MHSASAGQEPTVIRPASVDDLPDVIRVEQDSFREPWPPEWLWHEVGRRDTVYLVAECGGAVVGYVGMALCADEGHVGTLAVAPDCRRRGTGEALMLGLLEAAWARGARLVHLEYRVSNTAAAGLYGKLEFRPVRIRKGYYQDNGEDAVEVVLDDLDQPSRQAALGTLKQEWESHHGAIITRPG